MKEWSMTVTSVTIELLRRVVLHVMYSLYINNCIDLSIIKIKASHTIFLGETDKLDIIISLNILQQIVTNIVWRVSLNKFVQNENIENI